jgi:hypothetical protein
MQKRKLRRSVTEGDGVVLIEGELEKRAGSGLGLFSRRYFVVQGHYLKYATSREEALSNPKGAMCTRDILSSAIVGNKGEFAIMTAQAKTVLRAKDFVAAESWVAMLRSIADAAQSVTPADRLLAQAEVSLQDATATPSADSAVLAASKLGPLVLQVQILAARSLSKADSGLFGRADPYCDVFWEGNKKYSTAMKRRT